MADAVELMQALLGPTTTPQEAQSALDEALEREIEPLRWCALKFGICRNEIMRRGAAWADLAFFDVVPRFPQSELAAPRIEMLADVHMCRLRVLDRDVAFASPDFFGLLRLRKARWADPTLRRRVCLVPAPALRAVLVEGAQESLIDSARQTLVRYWPYAAAQLDLGLGMRWLFASGLLALAMVLMLAPLSGQLWLLPIWCVLMLLPTALRLGALLVPAQRANKIRREPDANLPHYSIMVPLRDEANMVDQLCLHLGALDYPAEKLEVIFVVESRSPDTVDAVQRHLGDTRFSLVVVPDAMPRTKPKALGFALPFCRGEFVVVYDAEDRPDAGQLRRIVDQFNKEPDLQCIQARLSIDNGEKGLMPALFTGEYAGLFAVMLPALARWGAVMPLGGTSNHFRLETLRKVGGWDAYNVTEDADLGVRLARRHLRTATSVSVTREAAPVELGLWVGQRTRWMKGWMQTFVVHNRRPALLLKDLGWRNFFAV